MLDNFLKKLFGETKETPEKEPPRKIRITKKGLCEILEVPTLTNTPEEKA